MTQNHAAPPRGARRAILTQAALLQLDPGMGSVQRGALLGCEGMEGPQKNYMPLVLGDQLYLILRAHPLVVARIDPHSLACSVVQREAAAPLSLQGVSGLAGAAAAAVAVAAAAGASVIAC